MKQNNCKLKLFILTFVCLGFVTALCLPTPGQASISTATGSALIDWANATLSGPTLNWLDPTGADTRNSFSSAWVGLNGVETDPGLSNTFEGGFVSTSSTAALNDVTGHATGMGATGGNSVIIDLDPNSPNYQGPSPNQNPATTIFASSNVSVNSALNNGVAQGDVFIAQAALTGQFTVDTAGTLNLTVPYSINLAASSSLDGFAYVDALLGLFLGFYDANGDFFNLTSDSRFPAISLIGQGQFAYTDAGNLTLAWNLTPGTLYDFEGSSSTVASANAVPEPGSLLFLGCSLMGMVFLKRRFL